MTQAHWRRLNGRDRARIREWVYKRDYGQCWVCGEFTEFDQGDVDHLDGQANDPHGRRTTDTTLMAWACAGCNRGTRNRGRKALQAP